MMITLEKIRSPLFDNLYESFLMDDDPLSDKQDWRNVFDYAWETEQGHCGYAMLDDGQVVGMMGMVFCERLIDGAIKKFCNLHTWWVREDHRGRSLALLRPILKLNDYTITHFTPCDRVRAISKRLGFKEISTQLRILLPQGRSRGNSADDSACTFDLPSIEENLCKRDQKIFSDHLPYGCGHLLVRQGNESCYIVYNHVVRHRLPYCHIQYINNREVFASQEPLVRAVLLKRHDVRFVALDERLIGDMKLRRSFKFWAPAQGLYLSSDVRSEQIDNLYSDIVFLHLTTLPHITHELRQLAGRMAPSLSKWRIPKKQKLSTG